MNKVLLLLLVGMLGLVTSSCVEETNALLITQNQLRAPSNCTPVASLDALSLSRGTMDVMLSNRYIMFPVLQNMLEPSRDVKLTGGAGGGTGGGIADLETEGNIVSLQGATVSFTAPNLSFPLPQNVFIPTSGAIFPQGVVATGLEVISPNLGDLIRSSVEFRPDGEFSRGSSITMLVSIKFKGITSSGTEVESNTFDFPLEVCAGCLLYYAPDTIFEDDDGSLTCDQRFDPRRNGEDTGTVEIPTEAISIPCFIGQDVSVDCRLCRTLPLQDIATDPSAICDPPN